MAANRPLTEAVMAAFALSEFSIFRYYGLLFLTVVRELKASSRDGPDSLVEEFVPKLASVQLKIIQLIMHVL